MLCNALYAQRLRQLKEDAQRLQGEMQAKLELEQRKREELEAVQVRLARFFYECSVTLCCAGAVEGLGAERSAGTRRGGRVEEQCCRGRKEGAGAAQLDLGAEEGPAGARGQGEGVRSPPSI